MQASNIETTEKPREGKGSLAFFLEFLRHPLQIGSVIPSSRFLEKRILETAGVARARMIVELGPGTGGTTRAILGAMADDARMLSLEINPQFHEMLCEIRDKRFRPHLGSACDIRESLSRHDLPAPDLVISGIPFSTMPRELGTRIIEEVRESLAPGGHFVAYQARDRVAVLGRDVMGPENAAPLELRNIPPMRVYRWRKDEA